MDLNTNDNGSLTLQISGEERDTWSQLRDERGYVSIEDVFADSDIRCNSEFESLRPEEVGALTDSPIIGHQVDRDDSGTLTSAERVWWFPNYMVTDPADALLEHGCVVFTPG